MFLSKIKELPRQLLNILGSVRQLFTVSLGNLEEVEFSYGTSSIQSFCWQQEEISKAAKGETAEKVKMTKMKLLDIRSSLRLNPLPGV